jgi:DNA (cytosine-5)-methyltransferase 1
MRVASFFSGIGGMDLGFEQAGFSTVWANENETSAAKMFSANFPNAHLDVRSFDNIDFSEIPDDVDGFIGGPPCQSWSIAGAHRGDKDPRGAILWTYVKAIESKKPKFFVLENVPGMTSSLHRHSYRQLLSRLSDAGYNISHGVLNAKNYDTPQARKRLFIVGYRKELSIRFTTPEKGTQRLSLRESLLGLDPASARPLKSVERNFEESQPMTANHYLDQDHFSYIYMSRNRVPEWDEMAFTVQASASHAQIHPMAPPMKKLEKDVYRFATGYESRYRRISVRESARIQTFPDDFLIKYESITKGYRMVGNAVPVSLAKAVASRISADFGINQNDITKNQTRATALLDFDLPIAI